MNRRIRIFVSSTFSDMEEDRHALMTHTWPELRRFCRERRVELTEVDLRWGVTQDQSARRETLKLLLDEIRACRPFFVGLLGERYGWIPGRDSYTPDLLEEQPWLRQLQDRSVTELEIVHGVLRSDTMRGRAFMYFRHPDYLRRIASTRRHLFASESPAHHARLVALKNTIRAARGKGFCRLREDYGTPIELAALVLEDLKQAIDAEFKVEPVPAPLARADREHEARGDAHCACYVARQNDFAALDQHAQGDGRPLVVQGPPGSGKTALLANWARQRRRDRPRDLVFEHYVGGAPESTDHAQVMVRLAGTIRRWIGDGDEAPASPDDIAAVFPGWMARLHWKAGQAGIKAIILLDGIDKLEGHDEGRQLGWLPPHLLKGPVRLVVSALPGEALQAAQSRGWNPLEIEPLRPAERRKVAETYLARYGKRLAPEHLDRLTAAPACANPLYLRVLLDELRVTGTHDSLDRRLAGYLSAATIPALLSRILDRYCSDYEHDRPGLIGDALSFILTAQRGLTETELRRLLRPPDQPQLPAAHWAPLRAALEESLADTDGVLSFAHPFIRSAVETKFSVDSGRRNACLARLADFFEAEPADARSSTELPWLLWETKQFTRLRACLLDIDRFLHLRRHDSIEVLRYWTRLRQERTMGPLYTSAYAQWAARKAEGPQLRAAAAFMLGSFLLESSMHVDAERMLRLGLQLEEQVAGPESPALVAYLSNLATLMGEGGRCAEAEPLLRRALKILRRESGVLTLSHAPLINSLAAVLHQLGRSDEAEREFSTCLSIYKGCYGDINPHVAAVLNNMAQVYQDMDRLGEAERFTLQAIDVGRQCLGEDHPTYAIYLNNLSQVYMAVGRTDDAEPILRRALAIDMQCYGENHAKVAIRLNNLGCLLMARGQFSEAEPPLRRALEIDRVCFGDSSRMVALRFTNLGTLLKKSGRVSEAVPLLQHAAEINSKALGEQHPELIGILSTLAHCLLVTGATAAARACADRWTGIVLTMSRNSDGQNVGLAKGIARLRNEGRSEVEIRTLLQQICFQQGAGS